MTLLRRFTPVVHRIDHAIGRLTPRRDVIVELRTPVYHAVLGPVAEALAEDPDVHVCFTGEHPERVRSLVPEDRFVTREAAEWRRFDLYLNADPWAPAPLRRVASRVNFFHGVAGKYDLDNPAGLPLGYEHYDRVAFVNRDRMQRYLATRIVTPGQAVLVGYPKLDRLATGSFDAGTIRAALGLAPGFRTALYAPTYSEASSLHLAGEAIVTSLVAAGFNVLVKLHDRSLDPDPRYNAGIDWRARFGAVERAHPKGRVCFTETADASPLLAVADVLVTDHSSIGFEYLVLDRPLIVYDAPDLAQAARINQEKVMLLRSAATVASTPAEVAHLASAAVRLPNAQSNARRRVARELFFDPGRATARAVTMIRQLLYPSRAEARAELAMKRGELT